MRGTLVDGAIADAYGMGFEFRDAEYVRTLNDLKTFRPHGLAPELPGGKYGDDTQMALAVSDVLLAHRDTLLDDGSVPPEAWADAIVKRFKADPRHGYSQNFRLLLESCETGADLLLQCHKTSETCGAAIRAAPIGWLPDEILVLRTAADQARITHDTPQAVEAAGAVALAAHYFLWDKGMKEGLGSYLNQWTNTGFDWNEAWKGPVSTKAYDVVRAAITAIMQGDTPAEVLKACIAFTGDVDSVAAVAMGVCGCSPEMSEGLPRELFTGFTDPGYDELFNQDEALEKAFA